MALDSRVVSSGVRNQLAMLVREGFNVDTVPEPGKENQFWGLHRGREQRFLATDGSTLSIRQMLDLKTSR